MSMRTRTGGNGPSCSGWVTNVSIGPEGVGIWTRRSFMVARHYAAADGAVKTPRQRGSMATLFSPEVVNKRASAGGAPAPRWPAARTARRHRDAIRLALRGAAPLQRQRYRLEQALQGNPRAVRAGRPGRFRQPVVRRAPLPHRVLGLPVSGGAAGRTEPDDPADPDRLRRVHPAVAPSGPRRRARRHARSADRPPPP